MDMLDFVRSMVNRTRVWRERAITGLEEIGCDLSYRPKSGMSSFGWLLAHQAAVYDFSLNIVIKEGPAKNSGLFSQHIPGTSGDWTRISKQEIENYYSDGESDLLAWVEEATDMDLLRILGGEKIPNTF
ncbi:MAG: DinB family protein, partial [Promethearchaeota archaeon]